MNRPSELPGLRSTQDVLNDLDRPTRTNLQNDGKAFEKALLITAAAYRSRGIATIEKCDPPTRVIGSGAARKILYLTNPYLDLVGCWTAQHGRALFLEAKSTSTNKLAFNRDGGFSINQWSAMKNWRRAGAACGLLWLYRLEVRLWTADMLALTEQADCKTLTHQEGIVVDRGVGNIVYDYLGALERTIWPEKAEPRAW